MQNQKGNISSKKIDKWLASNATWFCVTSVIFPLIYLFFYTQEQKHAVQINELEEQFHQKAKEIGMIQTELKTLKQFQKRKIQMEQELEDVSFFLF